MERSDDITTSTFTNDNNQQNSSLPLSTSSAAPRLQWPTIDGPLGLSEQDSIAYARKFLNFGFFLLPGLWAVNCFYFWPVLRHSRSFPQLRPSIFTLVDVVRSAIGFVVFTIALCLWALTFAFGGERLFGHVWDELVMYNVADKYGLVGWF